MDVCDVVGDLVGVAAVADADLVLERGFEGGRERKRRGREEGKGEEEEVEGEK